MTQNTAQVFDRQQVKSQLTQGLVTVTFTKKNGEQRIMTCTLNPDMIPQQQLPKPITEDAQPRKRDENSVSVWDVNAGGWRSFIWQNVIDVQITQS